MGRCAGQLQGLNATRVIALGSVSKDARSRDPARLGARARTIRGENRRGEEAQQSRRAWPGPGGSRCSWRRPFRPPPAMCREVYRARRNVLAAEVEQVFGPGRLQGLAPGCHALLRLPDGTSERAVEATAATMGVRVKGLDHYRFVASRAEVEPESRPPALVLAFGNVSEAQISKGIRKLAEPVRD